MLLMQINDVEYKLCLMLADTTFLTTKEKITLQNKIKTPEKLSLMTLDDICFSVGRTIKTTSWNGKKSLEKANYSYNIIKKLDIKSTFNEWDDFPLLLKEITDAPYVLFYRGNLSCLNEKCLSIVGSRKISYSAKLATELFAKEASDDNTTIVSGLAFGVDSYAHKGALLGKYGKTVAILPSGIDLITPATHKKLAMKILENEGLIMSEYIPGTPAQAFRYVHRNRILAGLSSATIVIQAQAGSGSMITAEFALDYNRDVYFHSECFSKESLILKDINLNELNKKVALKKLTDKDVKNKMQRSPAKFVQDGAVVINSYSDYCMIKDSCPSEEICKKSQEQIELFL